MQRRSPSSSSKLVETAAEAKRTESWEVAHLDRRDNPESHRARNGRRDGEGDRGRAPRTGRGGSQVRERRGPRPSLPRIDTAAQPAEDFVLLTDLLLQLLFRQLTLELLGLGPGRTARNLDSSPQ